VSELGSRCRDYEQRLIAAAEQASFISHLLLQLSLPDGRRWWYSPVLGRACVEVPAMPWGGFLAEEMGLGKVGCSFGRKSCAPTDDLTAASTLQLAEVMVQPKAAAAQLALLTAPPEFCLWCSQP
jgi:hypothetical protein